ncbi:hypothetical protein RIVM261_077920 [Rivularia sp. IAM M-261]|nr:hypothetical protein RIVM261_077920 [Rivularia sp. IAM M-261]
MVLSVKHFDVRLKQWVHTDNDTNNPDSILKDKLENTELEYFFPDKSFSATYIDEKITDEQLKNNHPDGHVLLLAQGTRLTYGSPECLPIIERIYPDSKDRAAYNILTSPCENSLIKTVNILVVDDANGENGGIIDNNQAYEMTGDGYGQITTKLYQELVGHQEEDEYALLQHRLCWKEGSGDDPYDRTAKGTFRPENLNGKTILFDKELTYQDENNKPTIDIIIPVSSFKGSDKDNPLGATKAQIKPGLYTQEIWLGGKTLSELTETAISQPIASFPKGIKDLAEQVELEAKKLKEIASDPRKTAEYYCEKHEKRKSFLKQQALELEEQGASDPEAAEKLAKLNAQIETESSIYKLIKKDLQGHGQLLETEKVKGELSRFLQNEWKDTSIGKNLSFERAMVIPSKNLQDGEVFIPHYKEGQVVPNFRSPFLNSNGMCVSTNKMVRDVLGPNGKPLKGVVAVSSETSEKIYNRLCKQIQEFIPALEQQNAKPEGIEEIFNQNQKFQLEASTKEEYKQKIKEKIDFTDKFNQYITKLQELGYKINPLPRESEQERQARDYDGDTIGFERAEKYPNLTAEAIERNLPQNAYDPTIKFKKQSFYEQDGSQPEFEKIAIHMADEISVGIINNHLTKVEALESEITILLEYGEEKDQLEYVQKVANYYEQIPDQDIPDQYLDYLQKFVDIVQNEPLTQESALLAMGLNQLMYREMIAEATFENQIAVDMKKSSRKPDVEIIEANEKVLHRDVNYIKDKKKGDVYIDQGIQPTGNSPVEILVSKVNQYFETSKLESRELTQFSKLFKGVDYTHQQYLQATLAKREYDKEFNNAARLSRRRETEKGPSASIDISGGKTLDVTNILKYNHPQIWNTQKIKLRVSPVDPEKRGSGGHKYKVYAQINDELEDGKPKFRTLGTISKEQEWKLEELGVQPGTEITSTKISLKPGLSEAQVKLAFQKASEIAQNFRSAIPDDQKLAMAAATYALSSTRESFGSSKNQAKSEVEQEIEKQKKVSNFVFTVFSDEIENQLEKLQFNDFVLTGYKYNLENEASEPQNLGQVQEVRFNISEQANKAGNSIVKDVIEVKDPETGEYKTFANINANDNKLPIGTTATGIIEKGEVYTATVTTKVPGQPEVTFTVKELQKFQAHDQIFNGEKVNLTIACNKLEREDYVIYFQNGAKEEKLGTIAEESLKNGIKEGWLAEKPGQSGQKLQLQLNSISTGDNAFVIGKTPEGNLLRINVEKKLQNKEFKNQEVSARVNAYDKLYVYTAKIGDVSLGVIGQHHERIQRDLEKKTGRQSSSRSNTLSQPEKLIQAGVIKENQFQTTIPVIINSNDGTCKLTIDPESVQYPETWVKRHQLVEKQKEVSPAEQKNNQLFDKITERPSILFQSRRDKSEGLVRLAVDSKKVKATEKFLESSGIKYEKLPQSQAKLEARKGITVFMLDESTITPEKKEQIIQRTGSIKDSTIPPKPIPVVREQTLYFKDPNQEYTLPDGKKEIREGIGIVVPLQDAKALSEWLELKNLNSGYLQQNDVAIFGVEKSEINDKLQRYLNRTLGKPIDITTVAGFKKYESFHQEINLKIETASLIKPDFVAPKSEYSKILQSLPNRAKKLNQEEAPLPMAPAKPLEVDGDIKNGEAEVLSNQTSSHTQTNEPVKLPSAKEANSTKAIEILGKVSEEKVQQLRSHLETHLKPLLENDKSNYSPGRQVAWVGAKWDLKEKDFKPGVQDDKLMELVKQVYPDADIVLVAYSKDPGAGINYHRDDSYAAIEARSINIGNSEWGYRAAKEQMAWTKEENTSAPYQEFKLESGTVTRFNCKNEHAALNTEAGRWSINIWSIKNDLGKENSVRQKFDNFIASNQEARAIVQSSVDLTIKSNEWTPRGEIKVERSYSSQKEATRNTLQNTKQLTVEELILIGNQTAARAANPQIPDNLNISGKPVPMNYGLHNYGDPPQVPVSTTIDAMRGYGRVHTTRGVDYQKVYGIKEGNIAIAVGKNNEQVAFRVGKQYEITEQMIKDPAYQQAWANWEKHSPKELTQSQAGKEKIYGLFIEPLGDYVNGKILPFPPIQQHETNNINPAVADKKEWARYAPEGKQAYEVLSVGDSRFSALNAKLKDGRTIEEAYQLDVKGYRTQGNDWRLGKGKPPLNPMSKEELYQAYKALWQDWSKENPQLIQELAEKSKGQVLTDRFANTEISQARALAEILNERQQSQLPNPLANLKPLNPAVAEHMKKDVAMAEVATQFIGKTAAPSETPSSTRNYAEAWGERANTGTYTKEDTIMVSGSGPWRGVTESQIKQTFKQHYIPLLDKAIEAQSTFVVGGAKGTDQLVQSYLKEKGYKLEQTNKGYTIATPIEKLIDTSTPSSNASQVPQQITTTKEIAPGINLTSRSPDPLGAVLTSTTVKSRNAGAIANDYPVSFRDNKEMPAGNYGPETYTEAKPAGQPFLSAEQAFFAYKESLPLNEPRVQLMAEIQQAKFEQYPQIMQAVTEKGGAEWLKQCSYLVSSGKPNFWEGKGLESPYIRALTQGYTKALEKTNSLATENQPEQPVKSTNQKPSQQETPISENKNENLNTEIKQALSNPSSRRQDSIDSTLDAIKQSTIQNLQHWYEAAQKLGRTEKYLNRIQEVTNQYTQDSSYNLEKAFKAMSQDIKELQQINETTKLAQNIVKVLGKTDINGIMSVKTENYKSYQIAARLEDNTYIIKDKDDKVLLFIKDGKTKAINLTEEVINDFRFMNFRIENGLQNVKRELIER